jgi:phenylpyruvate tautomerase PptA (4-oxalocrotonate tautomerase family)
MDEKLQEYVDSRGLRVRLDREAGILRGVKVLGLESRNGRSYLPAALAQAGPLYEGAKVNVNHPRGNPSGPRDYQDRIGTMQDVVVRPGEGVFADLHFNPKHALAEQLMWDAEHAPENVGFSHNVEARTARQGERVVVEAITRVLSVDLVADPATTRGLFESADAASSLWAGLTVEELARQRPDLIEAVRHESAAELTRLRETVSRLESAETVRQKRDMARRLLREYHLPDVDAPGAQAIVGRRFMESLCAAADEPAMRELVEERARLVKALTSSGGAGPRCREQGTVLDIAPADVKGFVAAIT